MLKKSAQKGFTIVELLIVIVVIGILAALVLNTFSGVQQRARDTERQTDVNSLATQLEAYYNGNGNGFYPQFSQIDEAGDATGLFEGMDAGVVYAPGFDTTGAPTLVSTESTGKDNYGYVALNADGDACDEDNTCVSYTLSYTKEDGNTVESKSSLNN